MAVPGLSNKHARVGRKRGVRLIVFFFFFNDAFKKIQPLLNKVFVDIDEELTLKEGIV